MTEQFRLSVVVPCYNEADNIPLIIARFSALLEREPGMEVILVDNGSTDKTAAVLSQCLAELAPSIRHHFQPVHVPKNEGYGYGILQGLSKARGQILGWTHADLQTDPADVLVALSHFKQEDATGLLVKGCRVNRPFADRFFSRAMQWLASAVLGVRLNEVNAQPKLFSRHCYEAWFDASAPKDFSLDLFLLYRAARAGVPVIEIPVTFADRLHGEAKGGGSWKTRWRLIRRTIHYIFALRSVL